MCAHAIVLLHPCHAFVQHMGQLHQCAAHLQALRNQPQRPGKCRRAAAILAGAIFADHNAENTLPAPGSRLMTHRTLAVQGCSLCRLAQDVRSRRISFSSYPGELFSDDDMYITDTRLVVGVHPGSWMCALYFIRALPHAETSSPSAQYPHLLVTQQERRQQQLKSSSCVSLLGKPPDC